MIAIFLAPFYILVNLYLVRWVLRWTGACHRVFGTRAFRAVFIVLYALIASAPLTGFLIRSPYALRKTLLQIGNYWFGWMLFSLQSFTPSLTDSIFGFGAIPDNSKISISSSFKILTASS